MMIEKLKMPNTRRRTHRPALRAVLLTAVCLAAALAALNGCSSVNEPSARGTISLQFYLEGAYGDPSLAPTQQNPDSVVVRVFRGGAGVDEETSAGVAVNGAPSVDVMITCIAENDKKVSVELFIGETMFYFGVDEHVDVVEDENSSVSIDAFDIFVDRVEVSDELIEPGDPALDIYWSRVPAAGSYLMLESTSPDFAPHLTQSFLTTDTIMTRSRPAGPWYYAVVPLNSYTVGSVSNVAYSYVTSPGELPPSIDGMGPAHAAPGEVVTLTGRNLDVPGRIWLGTAICPLLSASEAEIRFAVPLSGRTGPVTFENLFNSVRVPADLVVDRIAYVTRTNQDASNAQWYVDLVAQEFSVSSGVAVVPLSEVADRDMTVFDVIIVAHDVGTGGVEPNQETVDAISRSAAHVLAIGRGGQAFLSLAFIEMSGRTVTRQLRRDLFIPDGSLSLFQSPHQIAPQGPSVQAMCVTDQVFGGIQMDDIVLPSSVTTLAALSQTSADSYALLALEATVLFRTTYNFYWGYEGNPDLLTDVGRQCVANLISYLAGQGASSSAAVVRAPR